MDFQQLKEYHSVVDTANCVVELYFLYEKERITLNDNNNRERKRGQKRKLCESCLRMEKWVVLLFCLSSSSKLTVTIPCVFL